MFYTRFLLVLAIVTEIIIVYMLIVPRRQPQIKVAAPVFNYQPPQIIVQPTPVIVKVIVPRQKGPLQVEVVRPIHIAKESEVESR